MGFWETVGATVIGAGIVSAVGMLVRSWWRRLFGVKVVLRAAGNSIEDPRESDFRWYHAEVYCRNDVPALHPEVRVSLVAAGEIGPFGEWYFVGSTHGNPAPHAIRTTPLKIPLVLGNLSTEEKFLVASSGRPVAGLTWHLTPNGPQLGAAYGNTPGATLGFKARVSWIGGRFDAEFELRFAPPGLEPEFLQIQRRSRALPAIRRNRSGVKARHGGRRI